MSLARKADRPASEAKRIGMRAWWRRARFGIPTVLGLAPRGYFIPYRYAAALAEARPDPAYPLVAARLAAAEAEFQEVMGWIADFTADLERIGTGPPPAPRWDQGWFVGLDAAAAYALVRATRPQRIVEVGAGHSTRFLARAVADGDLATEITAIDPAPRTDLEGLGVRLLRAPLQQAPVDVFAVLGPGDLLLVDSSHILMPGSDVDRLLSEILPQLPAGVLVQFHDIFLPEAYPRRWEWRGYNEQQAVAPLLLGGDWTPRFASRYIVTRHPEWLETTPLAALPPAEGGYESALWLRKL